MFSCIAYVYICNLLNILLENMNVSQRKFNEIFIHKEILMIVASKNVYYEQNECHIT